MVSPKFDALLINQILLFMDDMESHRNKLLVYEEVLWLAPLMLVNLYIYSELPYWIWRENIELFGTLYNYSPGLDAAIGVSLSGVLTSLPVGFVFALIFCRRLLLYGLIMFIPSVVLWVISTNQPYILIYAFLGIIVSFIIFHIISVSANRYIGDRGPIKIKVKRYPLGMHKAVFILGSFGASLGLSFLIVAAVAVSHGEPHDFVTTAVFSVVLIISAIAYVYTKPA